MRARLYIPRSGDARALDALLGDNRAGDVRLDRDRIIVPVGVDDTPTGALVWRPTAFVHEFHCGNGLARRMAAAAMMNFAIADGLSRPHPVCDILFLVDGSNAPMLRYVRELGAVEQNGRIFTLDLAPGDIRHVENR